MRACCMLLQLADTINKRLIIEPVATSLLDAAASNLHTKSVTALLLGQIFGS